MEQVKDLLGLAYAERQNYLNPSNRAKIKIIEKTVCRFYTIKLDRVMAFDRHGHVVEARYMIYFFVRIFTRIPMARIAVMYKRPYFSTFQQAMARITRFYENDKYFRMKLENLYEEIKAKLETE